MYKCRGYQYMNLHYNALLISIGNWIIATRGPDCSTQPGPGALGVLEQLTDLRTPEKQLRVIPPTPTVRLTIPMLSLIIGQS